MSVNFILTDVVTVCLKLAKVENYGKLPDKLRRHSRGIPGKSLLFRDQALPEFLAEQGFVDKVLIAIAR